MEKFYQIKYNLVLERPNDLLKDPKINNYSSAKNSTGFKYSMTANCSDTDLIRSMAGYDYLTIYCEK